MLLSVLFWVLQVRTKLPIDPPVQMLMMTLMMMMMAMNDDEEEEDGDKKATYPTIGESVKVAMR